MTEMKRNEVIETSNGGKLVGLRDDGTHVVRNRNAAAHSIEEEDIWSHLVAELEFKIKELFSACQMNRQSIMRHNNNRNSPSAFNK
jgi:hypothetical protein